MVDGDQLKISQVESVFEIQKPERKKRLRDLKHWLKQEWRIGLIASQARHMEPGRSRDKAIEDFWISVYNGSYPCDPGFLQMKGWDLAQYLHHIESHYRKIRNLHQRNQESP
jgi:hypothetical protein